MLMSCRFCGGDVRVEESWIRASPVHVICVSGFMAKCVACGQSSGFSTDREMALRSMCLNLDGPVGQKLIADVLRAAEGASYFLPPFSSVAIC